MKINIRIIQIIFAIPWLVFGIQHYLYADFVATLVPSIFPYQQFWAYFTGAAMFLAGLAIMFNIKARLASLMLGLMILCFILLIHIPKLAYDMSAATRMRALQDGAICLAAILLAEIIGKSGNLFLSRIANVGKYIFAVCLIAFGIGQFMNLDFLTARVPEYLPFRMLWVYFTAAVMASAGISVLINKKAQNTVFVLGMVMIILNVLSYAVPLVQTPSAPRLWTAAMIDLTLTAGVFILANYLIENTAEQTKQTETP